MKKRLFFNGINIFRNDHPIDQAVEYPFPIFPHPAYTTLRRVNPAPVTAEMAFHLAVIHLFI